jgi:hypothetical protein
MLTFLFAAVYAAIFALLAPAMIRTEQARLRELDDPASTLGLF